MINEATGGTPDSERDFQASPEAKGGAEREQAEARVVLTIGALQRKDAMRQIEAAAHLKGIELVVVEDKGILDSQYEITLRGSGQEVQSMYAGIEDFINQINGLESAS